MFNSRSVGRWGHRESDLDSSCSESPTRLFCDITGAWVLHADAWACIVYIYPALTIPMNEILQE
eukprot:5442461-Pyramimonas_sp.AAC.1